MGETRRIEWPPRSGVEAEYAPDEEAFLRVLVRGCEDGLYDERQLAREVGVLHDAKAFLDARIVRDDGPDREPADFEPAPPDSPFQVPGRAADLLAVHDPQLRIA